MRSAWLFVVSSIAIIIAPFGIKAAELPPQPETIKATVREILRKSPYQYHETDLYTLDLSWLRELLAAPFHAFARMLGFTTPIIAWIITLLLVVVLFALLAHIVYTLYLTMGTSKGQFVLDEEPRLRDPRMLIEESQRLAEQKIYADATRKLYLAALIMLENKRDGRVQQGLTNNEYLRTFQSKWILENLNVFVELINWKWYREREMSYQDYAHCQKAFEVIQIRLAEMH
jgi:hypothetical protein